MKAAVVAHASSVDYLHARVERALRPMVRKACRAIAKESFDQSVAVRILVEMLQEVLCKVDENNLVDEEMRRALEHVRSRDRQLLH